jgi:hypothetical protein
MAMMESRIVPMINIGIIHHIALAVSVIIAKQFRSFLMNEIAV